MFSGVTNKVAVRRTPLQRRKPLIVIIISIVVVKVVIVAFAITARPCSFAAYADRIFVVGSVFANRFMQSCSLSQACCLATALGRTYSLCG